MSTEGCRPRLPGGTVSLRCRVPGGPGWAGRVRRGSRHRRRGRGVRPNLRTPPSQL